MIADSDILATFRRQVTSIRSSDTAAWEASRHLVTSTEWLKTLTSLRQAVVASAFPDEIKHHLVATLSQVSTPADSHLFGDALKRLTGLPATKALRALCVLFGIQTT